MYGPSLCRPTLLWAKFATDQVCYGPRCPITVCYLVSFTPSKPKDFQLPCSFFLLLVSLLIDR